MGWRDLLYFSRGERRALCLLLAIVAGGWGLMVWMDHHQAANQPPSETEPQQVAPDDTIPTAVTTADTVITPQTGRRPTTPLRAKRAPIDRRIREYRYPPRLRAKRAPIDRRIREYRYPPRESNKFPEGTIVDLNRADSLTLQRVPGIGPTFARRIVKYRKLLGGFREVGQLREVYGITPERYAALSPWFRADTSLLVRRDLNQLSFKEMLRHPYIDYEQARALSNLIRRKGHISGWDEVRLLDEFPETAIQKLDAYFLFALFHDNRLPRDRQGVHRQ